MSLAPYTFAGFYRDEFTDRYGNAWPGVPVLVTRDGAPVTVYTSRVADVEAANPVIADELGNVAFYAAPGRYELIATVDGDPEPPIVVTVPVDPLDGIEHPGRHVHEEMGLATIEMLATIPQGPPGEDGSGIPPGGLTGEALVKLTDEDGEADWAPVATSAAGLSFTPTGTIEATTVQTAIAELDADVDGLAADLAVEALTRGDEIAQVQTGIAGVSADVELRETTVAAAAARQAHVDAPAPHDPAGFVRAVVYSAAAPGGEIKTGGITFHVRMPGGNDPGPTSAVPPEDYDIKFDASGV